jgi:hypothetical protein
MLMLVLLLLVLHRAILHPMYELLLYGLLSTYVIVPNQVIVVGGLSHSSMESGACIG